MNVKEYRNSLEAEIAKAEAAASSLAEKKPEPLGDEERKLAQATLDVVRERLGEVLSEALLQTGPASAPAIVGTLLKTAAQAAPARERSEAAGALAAAYHFVRLCGRQPPHALLVDLGAAFPPMRPRALRSIKERESWVRTFNLNAVASGRATIATPEDMRDYNPTGEGKAPPERCPDREKLTAAVVAAVAPDPETETEGEAG